MCAFRVQKPLLEIVPFVQGYELPSHAASHVPTFHAIGPHLTSHFPCFTPLIPHHLAHMWPPIFNKLKTTSAHRNYFWSSTDMIDPSSLCKQCYQQNSCTAVVREINPKPCGYINFCCRAARSHIWLCRRPIGKREALRHAPAVVGSSRPTLRKS